MKKIEYRVCCGSVDIWHEDGKSCVEFPIEVLIITKVTHKGREFTNSHENFYSPALEFSLGYNDKIIISDNGVSFYQGSQILPPNNEWLSKCIGR